MKKIFAYVHKQRGALLTSFGAGLFLYNILGWSFSIRTDGLYYPEENRFFAAFGLALIIIGVLILRVKKDSEAD